MRSERHNAQDRYTHKAPNSSNIVDLNNHPDVSPRDAKALREWKALGLVAS
jgi:hypothetical protein